MKNKTVKLMAVFMAVAMAMTACGDSGGDSKESSGDNQEKSSAEESGKEEESSRLFYTTPRPPDREQNPFASFALQKKNKPLV